MSRLLRIAIVGYGIAGAAAAVLLRRSGHQVEIFERHGRDASAGAGLLLNPATFPRLEELGILQATLDRGSRVTRVVADSVSGRRLMNLEFGDASQLRFALGIQRRALLNLLRGAVSADVPIHWNRAAESADPECGELILADRVPAGPYDLIVATDGAGSALRRSLPSLVARNKLSCSAAIVCLIDDPNGACDGSVRQRFEGIQHVSVWPVGTSDDAACPRANISTNVPLRCAEVWRADDGWRRVISRLLPDLGAALSRPSNEVVTPIIYSYRDVALRRFASGRIVLLGDSAHSMSPQFGQGVLLALQDASALANSLVTNADTDLALRQFGELRQPPIAAIQRASRCITPMFQSESRVLAALRDATLPRLMTNRLVRNRMGRLIGTA